MLRDIRKDIGKTAIIGVSPDEPAKQLKFDKKFDLGFTLLADTEHKVAKAYKVWKKKSMYGREYMGIERSAFLIDEKGKSCTLGTKSHQKIRQRICWKPSVNDQFPVAKRVDRTPRTVSVR